MKELLRELVETPGVSGSEKKIRETIREKVEEHASVEEDGFGNLIARKGEGEKTLLLDAHMDQIGLSVKHVGENGFIHFSKIGGVTRHSLLNQRVNIHTSEGEITGVIGLKPPHLMEDEEREKMPEIDQLFIDIGAEDEEEARDRGVEVGDTVTFDQTLDEVKDGVLTSMAMDNRVGSAVAIEALKRFEGDYELVVVFAAQEEVGLKGAKTAAYHVEPDAALAVDVSMAGDVPGIEPKETDLALGDGVEITMVQSEGRGLITPEKVREWLVETAEEEDHDYQKEVWEGGATDAAKIELVKEGIPTGSVGVPLRNMHSATEVVDVEDMEETVDFLESAFGTFEDYF